MTEHGPSWLGIGAQRCGTTWFTDLLTQHPLVGVPEGTKEHNELFRFGLMRRWDEEAAQEYRKLFSHEEVHLGEFSPAYMRSLWICEQTLEVLPPEAPIIVLVRDPLDRFASGLRHMMLHAIRRHQKRLGKAALEKSKGGFDEVEDEKDPPLKPLPGKPRRQVSIARERMTFLERVAASAATRYVLGPPDGRGMQDRTWLRYVGGDATWAGMYGAQLQAWTEVVPKDRFVLIQYERMKKDPQHYVDQVWKRLDVDPVPLKNIGQKSHSSTRPELWVLEDHPHLVRTLRAAYRADAELLASEWDVDLSLWKHLMGGD